MSAANNVATTTNVPALPQMVLTVDWFVEELVGSKMCVSAHSCETNVIDKIHFHGEDSIRDFIPITWYNKCH